MNLARKMVVLNRTDLSALYILLLFRLTCPTNRITTGDRRCFPKYMPKRITSRRFSMYSRMTRNHPKLLAFLPRFMLMGRNQRAFVIPSLVGIPLYQQLDTSMRNMKVLRAMFRTMYASEHPFAIEFISIISMVEERDCVFEKLKSTLSP